MYPASDKRPEQMLDTSGSSADIVPKTSSTNASEPDLANLGLIVPDPGSQILDLPPLAQGGPGISKTSISNDSPEHIPLDKNSPHSKNLPQSSHSSPQSAREFPVSGSPTNASFGLRSESSIDVSKATQYTSLDEGDGSGAQAAGTRESHPSVDDWRRSAPPSNTSTINNGESIDSVSEHSGFYSMNASTSGVSQTSTRRTGDRAFRGGIENQTPEGVIEDRISEGGICRAILIETNTRDQQRTATNTQDRQPNATVTSQRRYYRFDTNNRREEWSDLLQNLDVVKRDTAKCFILIIDGSPSKDQAERLEVLLNGVHHIFDKKPYKRLLPTVHRRGLLLDTLYVFDKDDPKAHEVRVWISNSNFTVLLYRKPKYEKFRREIQDQPHQDQQQQNQQNLNQQTNEQEAQEKLDREEGFIGSRFAAHYAESKRWARYQESRGWVIIDTYSLLYAKGWNKSFIALTKKMEKERLMASGSVAHAPVTLISTSLHKFQDQMLFLMELKRFQRAVLERIFIALDEKVIGEKKIVFTSSLKFRLKCLEHQETIDQALIQNLRERAENSIDLLFNSATFDQSKDVNRISYFVFIFAPISFATSVWGMTNFTISAKWVAAFALPLLAATLIVAWLSYKLSRVLDNHRHERMSREGRSHMVTGHRLYRAFGGHDRARRRQQTTVEGDV